MRTSPIAPVTSFSRSFFGNTIRLRNQPARLLVLLALIAVGVSALASTSTSASSFGQMLFGKATTMIGLGSVRATPAIKATRMNPALMALSAPQPPSATMLVERRGHTATKLSDGNVLIAGGENSSGPLNESEIYDPAAATFSVIGNMGAARADHSATLLADGRVLIAGGRDAAGALNTTEIFDPATGAFSTGPAMSVARAGHSATLFADGRIFIAAGDAIGSAEILDVAAGSSSNVGSMSIARSAHSAALMSDGRILVVGGHDGGGNELSSAEIFDTPAGTFSTVDSLLKVARVHAHLRVLFDGKVQIIGGSSDGSMEIYDPLYGAFGAYAHVLPESDTCAGLPAQVLASQTRAALFHNGQSDPLFDRTAQTITEMNGQALVLGGANSSGTVLNSSSVVASSSAAITTDKMDYAPGETATITGRGFQPGETVRVKIHEDPHTPQERGFDAVADADGNFSGQYLVMDYDLSMKFIVGARGLTSGAVAQTSFTDGNSAVTGTVKSSDAGNPPISGATVSNSCDADTATTNASGIYSIANVNYPGTAATCDITASAPGFTSQTISASLSNGGTTTVNFTLTPSCISPTVTTNPTNQVVTYGDASASFTAAASGSPAPSVQWQVQLGGAGPFSNLSNVAPYSGVTTGTLLISNPTVSLSGNKYQAVFTNTCVPATATSTVATLTVNKRNATWTTNPNSKTYGDADPVPLTTGSGDFLVADGVTATYSRVAGENASPPTYHITATLAPAGVLGNYNITNAGAEFTINKRNATWTTDPNSKTYGDLDPVPLTTGSGDFLVADGVTATYSRVAGENASPPTYHITATLAPAGVLGNYNITNAGAEFTINKRDATWTTNANSKTYGDADPVPLTTGSGDFLVADGVTATYSRVAGENASPPTYHITATLSATPLAALDNYIITNDGAEFTINKRTATWTTNPNSKTYGNSDPVPLTTGSGSNFVASDTVTATYSRVAGESASPPTYHISATLSATGDLNNYIITNAGAEFTINKRPLVITASDQSKTYGDSLALGTSAFTTNGGEAPGEVVTSVTLTSTGGLAGSVTTAAGMYPGNIVPSAPSGTGGFLVGNYYITFNNGKLTVNQRPATVTANDKSRIYGVVNPTLDATVTGTVNGDTLNYTLATLATQFSLVGNYPITVTLGSNPNYNVTKTDGTLTITTAYCFNGFLAPIGGSVETANGGSFADPVRAFKLGSTIPVKFIISSLDGSTCGPVVTTGIHTLQAVYYSNMVDSESAIDATPTDAATDGNQFRLTSPEWHFNLSTKGGFKAGTWLLKATLQDGSIHTVWISIKK